MQWKHGRTSFFERKNSSPTLTFLQERTALLIPTGTSWKPLSHTEAWYTSSLSTRCQNGNILFGCETAVSDSPLPLSADLSGSPDLCVMGMQEPNPPQCNAVAASLWGFCRSPQHGPTHQPCLARPLPWLWNQQFYFMIFKYWPN